MRFGHQQMFIIFPAMVVLNLPYLMEKMRPDTESWGLPFPVEVVLMLIVYLAIVRVPFWLAWTSNPDRGNRFFKAVGVTRERILSGFGSGLLQWYCHVDDKGHDKDIVRK